MMRTFMLAAGPAVGQGDRGQGTVRDLARFLRRGCRGVSARGRGPLRRVVDVAAQPRRDERQDRTGGAERDGEGVVRLESSLVEPDANVAREPEAEAAPEAVGAGEGATDEEPSPRLVGRGPHDRVTRRCREHLGRIVGRLGELVGGYAEALDRVLHDGLGDRLLGDEVVVEGPEADVRRVGDLLDRRGPDALARHELARRRHELRPRLQAAPRAAAGGRVWAAGDRLVEALGGMAAVLPPE